MDTENHYNRMYSTPNCFQYSERLYDSYIKALIKKFDLKKGSTVLDAPCGQGFFSYLFSKNGMKVCGTDLSNVGIEHAQKSYPASNIRFLAGDIRKLSFPEQFDCVYTRSCSLYNAEDYAFNSEMTQHLLSFLKPDGLFIFAYNTNLRGSHEGAGKWINHTLGDVQRHFESFAQYQPQFYLINKIDTFLFKEYAFNRAFVSINNCLLPRLKRNGDVLCVFRKSKAGAGQILTEEANRGGLPGR